MPGIENAWIGEAFTAKLEEATGKHCDLCFFPFCILAEAARLLRASLLAICTAVASCFVVDRACTKFAPFYGLSIESHLFTAAYEWR